MAYLLPAGTAPRTKNKWMLGHWKNVSQSHTGPRMGNLRGLSRWKIYQQSAGPGALGQDPTTYDPGDVLTPPIIQPIPAPPAIPFLPSTQPVDTTMISAPTVLQQPGVNPVTVAYQNLLTQQQNSQNPLDYVSPQAAIAAGLPAQTVYNAWSSAMARFPTQQAALNAGIPAGVVTQLWAQSRAAVPAASTNTFLGVPITYLLGGGFALFVLAGLRGKR